VPTEPLRGKVVIDTCNYCPQRDGRITELDDRSSTSSELVQRLLPGTHVVKAFNSIQLSHLGSLQRLQGDASCSVPAIAAPAGSGRQVTADQMRARLAEAIR
jgi:predicted dinucleotide-binding enzyme